MGVSQISLNTRSKIVQKKLAIIEKLAKYLKNITLGDDTKLDYSQLELLIKMRCNQTSTRINYNSFCQWLG